MAKQLSSRQRLIRTLRGEPADCVPVAPLADSFAAKERQVPYARLTWQDQVQVARATGLDLLLNTAAVLPQAVAAAWQRSAEGTRDGLPIYRETLATPAGNLSRVIQELPYNLPWTLEYPVKSEADLRAFEYVMDQVAESGEALAAIAQAAAGVGEDGLVHTWVTIPLELFGWMERAEATIFAVEHPERMRGLCERIHRGQMKMAASALRQGSDILAFGIIGTEMTSPALYREFAKPYARDFVELAGRAQRWSLLHMCGHVRPLLADIREIHPTVLETLAPPPEGDTPSIPAARTILGRDIVVKGNMNLTFLANASPSEVYAAGQDIIRLAGTDRFILGCADVLLDYHPLANVKALARAGHEWRLDG
jgi:uroporphyrinogen-III decarboxylase